jgi:yeast amino acid transporter
MSVCIAYIRFHAALEAQGIDRSTMPYRSPFQPYLAYIAVTFFSIVIFFNGLDSIAGGFNYQSFLTCYIGVPIFFRLFIY